ncbi:P-loop containing nucleoside triphosphate hydrolase, putative [Plasmodium sp. DRC-Itaito]|nr:P-loop containing nucleoside triphosphate hydrolase, putative [Plasmodium sp. DRC-Itaito]
MRKTSVNKKRKGSDKSSSRKNSLQETFDTNSSINEKAHDSLNDEATNLEKAEESTKNLNEINNNIKNEDDEEDIKFLIEHIDFKHFCNIKKKESADCKNKKNDDNINDDKINNSNSNSNHCKNNNINDNMEYNNNPLKIIGKTYDYLRRKNFKSVHLKKLENYQYFEKILWPYYNMYDKFYELNNNNIFFHPNDELNNKTNIHLKHLLSIVIFLCYKYEEKGKHEIWEQLIYNKIDEFEKLVYNEKNGLNGNTNIFNIDEKYNLYKEFLIEKFNNLFFNTLKLINYNFVISEFLSFHLKSNNDEILLENLKRYREKLFKLNFLEKSYILQFFINIYSSIDKKFLFKLCVDLCNPFIWIYINETYLNNFLFKTNEDAKLLYNNILNVMKRKYHNYENYDLLSIYTSNCILDTQEEEQNIRNHDKKKRRKSSTKINDSIQNEENKFSYDENVILFINKNAFFYNLINYFLLVLDYVERNNFDDVNDTDILSDTSDGENVFDKMNIFENDDDILYTFDDNKKIGTQLLEKLKIINENITEEDNTISYLENIDMLQKCENKIYDETYNKNTNVSFNFELQNKEENIINDYKYFSSEDDLYQYNEYNNNNNNIKDEILNIFSKYEKKVKDMNNKVYIYRKNKVPKKDTCTQNNNKYILLFIEKCIEFFIDLLSQLYSRRILYIFLKYFNVYIYCKISKLNKHNRQFKELIKLFKYYMEMYIDNFSGNPLTYLEINNEHYKNFESFQIFCYKYYKDHNILKNYYLKSVYVMDKKKEMWENLTKLDHNVLSFLCQNLKYVIKMDTYIEDDESISEPKKKASITSDTHMNDNINNINNMNNIHNNNNNNNNNSSSSSRGGKKGRKGNNKRNEEKIEKKLESKVEKNSEEYNSYNKNKYNYLFNHLNIFHEKKKIFYIILLIENLSFKKNIFEEIEKKCDYPNEMDLFDNILIDSNEDIKNKTNEKNKKKKYVLYTKPLFKLNLQYLCINDYIFRIYNLFKLQSYYDIKKNILEYVYETNPKNKKVNESTILKYVYEIDDDNIDYHNMNEKEYKKNYYNNDDTDSYQLSNIVDNVNNMTKKRKSNNDIEENDVILDDDNNINKNIYNEYQLKSIIVDINKIENTYFANERRMSNKIDSFKIINVDDDNKKVTAEIIIDLRYKQYERIKNEWNMIRSSDILFLVSVRNYSNLYKNKLNVINDNDMKKLLGINYVRGCEVVKYANMGNDDEDINSKKCTLKKITVYLDYIQYQKDILNNPDIYESFNLLIRRKQKENNFYYILNNIKTLILNPDDAIIPHWVHDIFLGYCDSSIKYYDETLHKVYHPDKDEEIEEDESDSDNNSVEYQTGSDDNNNDNINDEDKTDSDNITDNDARNNYHNSNASDVLSNDDEIQSSKSLIKNKYFYNKALLNFIKRNVDDINYLNTFLNIGHILKTTNVGYMCVDLSYMNILNDNNFNVHDFLNEYIEPLYLSYVPIKYEHEKDCMKRNVLEKNIIESLFYHICVINKYKIDDTNFVSKFVTNIDLVYECHNNFFVFQFEFKEKKYFLIFNNFLCKEQNEKNVVEQVEENQYEDGSTQKKKKIINNNNNNNKNIPKKTKQKKNNNEFINGDHYDQHNYDNNIHNDDDKSEATLDNMTQKNNNKCVIIKDQNKIKNIYHKVIEDSIKYIRIKDGIYRLQNKIYEDPNYPLEGLLIHTQKKNSTNVKYINNEKKKEIIKKNIYYTERQIECIKSGIYKGITIIEGVPGSGKTSILNKIINILFNNKKNEKILICTHSNSCLNYIFNLLVKENVIHQKYLCRVGMGEVDSENFINEYEIMNDKLSKQYNMKDEYMNTYELNNIYNYDDENFNFSKYGRINYMLDLRQKLLNDVNLLSESYNNQKIYNCLTANQYYERYVKKRIYLYFQFVYLFKNKFNNEEKKVDEFFNLYLSSSLEDYDIYNLFLCPKIYVHNHEHNNIDELLWKNYNMEENNNCKNIKCMDLLKDDEPYFYLIHPEKQLKVLNLSIYNILFPFKKYINLKLKGISVQTYLENKSKLYENKKGEYNLQVQDKIVETNFISDENHVTNGVINTDYDNNDNNINNDDVLNDNSRSNNENSGDIAQINHLEDNVKNENILKKNKNTNHPYINEHVDENHLHIQFHQGEDDLYVSKYYLSQLFKNFEHLKDCRAFEVLRNQRERCTYIIAKLARVIAMTCTHASINRSKIAKLQFYFDNIIIDECTQITENDTFLPLLLQENRYYKSKLKRIIFVGDSNQLPPIIKNKYIKDFANYEQSLYKRFLRLDLPSIYLNEQGRMRSEICNIYKYFYSKYNIEISNLECIYKENFVKSFNPGFTYTYQFIHVPSEEYSPIPYFYQNLLEAEMTVAIYMYMRLIGYPNDVITILTTYNGQKELILDILKKNCMYNKLIGMPKKVTTVDKYQGKQNDYIILSLVRSRSIGYMKNIKRLIVAFSRARFGLYVLGNYNLYKKAYEFKKPLYFFKKNKLQLSLHLNEHYLNTTHRHIENTSNNSSLIINDLNHFYTIIYSLLNYQLQQPKK